MIFPGISKFNAELVKVVSRYARDSVKHELLSTPGQVTPRGTHMTVYACPNYQ